MKSTYTYTARSADDPDDIATFTLHDGRISIEMGNTLLERVSQVAENIGHVEDIDALPVVGAFATGILQHELNPFELADFHADLEGETLQVSAWIRSKGLRLAPIMFTWRHVDNLDAAKAFVEKVNKEKRSALKSGHFPGVFDYWLGWMAAALALLAIPAIWRVRQAAHSDS